MLQGTIIGNGSVSSISSENLPEHGFLTLGEAAPYLRMAIVKIRKLVKAGKLPVPVVKIGKRNHVRVTALRAFLDGDEQEARGERSNEDVPQDHPGDEK